MLRRYSCILAAAAVALFPLTLAAAGKSSGSVKITNQDDLTRDIEVEATLPSGQTVSQTIDCYKSTAGRYKKQKGGAVLVKLSVDVSASKKAASKLKKEMKRYKGKKGSAKKLYNKAKRKYAAAALRRNGLVAIAGVANEACNTPDYLSLSKYTGPFGAAQAQVLCNRFLFGCTHTQLQAAATQGLDAFVAEITTPVSEAALEESFRDLVCDGKLAGQAENEACNPDDPNDLYTPGVRYGLYRYALLSQRPLFWKLWMWAHDEFMAGSTSAVNGCERYAVLEHFNMLKNFALSEDFRSFIHAYDSDILGNLRWLDGALNIGTSPNENYAREKFELGMMGVKDANGNPTHGDLDVAQSALAHSGWQIEYKNIMVNGQEYGICYKGYFPGLHAQDPKYIFAGTPYQAVVYNAADVLNATLNHHATAENIARKLWAEFVNPYATPLVLKQLAKKIRAANYNINAVLPMIMKSRAMFAATSKNSLIRDSFETLVGFLRSTQIPLADPNYPSPYNYEWMDDQLRRLDMRPMQPDTVFGFYPQSQTGAAKVSDRRNVFTSIMLQSNENLESKNFEFGSILSGMTNTGNDALDVVNHVAMILGISLNENQKQQYVQYLTHDAHDCNSWQVQQGNCSSTEQPYYLKLEGFIANPAFDNFEKKLRGLILMMTRHPLFATK